MRGPIAGTGAFLVAAHFTTAAQPDAAIFPLASVSVPQAPLSGLLLSFAFYGFMGWLWESTVCSLMNQGRFTNSGFLLGPICPIYGVGALADWLLLRGVDNVFALFFVAGTLCCLIEYVVGVGLERMTGARFWDYDDKPLNIQGRVCLYGFLLFGAGSVLICRISEPWLLGLMGYVPGLVLAFLALAFVMALVIDLVGTLASWRRLSTRLEEVRAQAEVRINESLGEASERMLDRIPERAVETAATAVARTREASSDLLSRLSLPEPPAWLSDAADAMVERLGRRDLRFFNAFPRLRIPRYEGVISATHLKDRVRELFGSGK